MLAEDPLIFGLFTILKFSHNYFYFIWKVSKITSSSCSNTRCMYLLSWGKINVNWLSSCVQIADWHTILKALIIAKVISDPKTINKNLQMGRVTCHAKQWPTTTSKEISNHARLIGHLSKTEKMIPYYKEWFFHLYPFSFYLVYLTSHIILYYLSSSYTLS